MERKIKGHPINRIFIIYHPTSFQDTIHRKKRMFIIRRLIIYEKFNCNYRFINRCIWL